MAAFSLGTGRRNYNLQIRFEILTPYHNINTNIFRVSELPDRLKNVEFEPQLDFANIHSFRRVFYMKVH